MASTLSGTSARPAPWVAGPSGSGRGAAGRIGARGPQLAGRSLRVNVLPERTEEDSDTVAYAGPPVLTGFGKGVGLSAALAVAACIAPEHASAGEALSSDLLQFFQDWLARIDSLGNAGPALFIMTVTFAEMIPLFPTQPFFLAGGLLFGPKVGGACVLTACVVAAFSAYSISKGVGRKLAERVISSEMEEAAEAGAVAAKIAEVKAQIETGGPWQQYCAVAALRLTPIVPFSASNYILGLTPVPPAPFLAGTLTGMLVWSTVYASLGGAARGLLDKGVPLGDVIARLQEQVAEYTDIALVGFGAVAAAAAAYAYLRPEPAAEDPAPGEPAAALQKAKKAEVDKVNVR